MTDKVFDKALQKQMADAQQQQSKNRATRPASSELITAFAKATLNIIRSHLLRDGIVRIHQFGTFRLRISKARKIYNPRTQQTVLQSPKARVVFTPAKALREKIEPHPLPVQALHNEQSVKPEPPATTRPVSIPSTLNIPAITENNPITSAGKTADTFAQNLTRKSYSPETVSPSGDKIPASRLYSLDPGNRGFKPQSEPETLRQMRQISDHRESLSLLPEPVASVETAAGDDNWEVKPLSKTEPGNNPVLQTQFVEHSQEPYNRTSLQQPAQTSKRNAVVTLFLVIALLAVLLFWLYPPSDRSQLQQTLSITSTPEPVITPSIPEPDISNATEVETITDHARHEESGETTPIAEYSPLTSRPMPSRETPFFTEKHYEIKNGDNLWGLSRKHYVNPFIWPHIYRANYGRLISPDLLDINATITLPMLQGPPAKLARIDRHSIAEGYFLLYKHYKSIGYSNPHHALIGVKWFAAEILTLHEAEIDPLDISKLYARRQDNALIQSALSRSAP